MQEYRREHLSQPFFNDISRGAKIFEGRINKPGKFTLNEIIIWYNNDNGRELELKTQIVNLRVFLSFKDAIEEVGIENILPSQVGNSIDDAISNVYRVFYDEALEIRYGVILLEIEIIE